jgi:hypothetical protein
VTKMQIIAKAVLTFLGLSAFVKFSQNFRTMTSLSQTQDTSILRDILFSLFVIILLIAIAYWLILKNDWLVRKISVSGEKLDPESETLWLVSSLRMIAVIYGLTLLASAMPAILNIIVSPLWILSLINEALTFKTFPKSIASEARQWLYTIYNFLEAILAVYLLYGWPQFIRYQLNIRKTKLPFNQNPNAEGIEK